jgi:hypothetical protein
MGIVDPRIRWHAQAVACAVGLSARVPVWLLHPGPSLLRFRSPARKQSKKSQ